MRDDSYLESGTASDSKTRTWRGGVATAVGATVSLAILAAVVTWSYRLGVRDAEDIPVIRAQSGETRMKPDEPGGLEVSFRDRAVYDAVNGDDGSTAAGALAPPPETLKPEDAPVVDASPAPPPRPDAAEEAEEAAASEQTETPVPPEPLVAAASDAAEEDISETDLIQSAVDAVLAEAGGDVSDDTDGADGTFETDGTVEAGETGETEAAAIAPQYAPRAAPRPARRVAARPTAEPETDEPRAAAAQSSVQIQLGAYLSEEIAAQEWTRIKSGNGDLLRGRARVVTSVQSGGRTFYRLRAGPFAEVAEASTLCRGLKARNQACIVARAE